jgi:hypothetical protein
MVWQGGKRVRSRVERWWVEDMAKTSYKYVSVALELDVLPEAQTCWFDRGTHRSKRNNWLCQTHQERG